MWRWIAKVWVKGKDVEKLKRRWLRDNGFTASPLSSNCFFCNYITSAEHCDGCPGRLVDSSFSCFREAYNFEQNPPAFYRELLRLNRMRKAKK
jgi:hypothetical protein